MITAWIEQSWLTNHSINENTYKYISGDSRVEVAGMALAYQRKRFNLEFALST